ncbi:MAG: NAD(P)-binding domain-containing protein, partial [Salinibacter sp.]
MPDAAASPPVAVVGAGAVGTPLARGLVASGYRVEAVLSRTPETAQTLADRVGASVAGTRNEALPAAVRLILISVPDDAIADVAEGLATLDHPWDETIVAHTSGAETAAVLAPVARQGAATLSFHPLQTFTEETSPEAFEDIVVGLEGEDRAVAA